VLEVVLVGMRATPPGLHSALSPMQHRVVVAAAVAAAVYWTASLITPQPRPADKHPPQHPHSSPRGFKPWRDGKQLHERAVAPGPKIPVLIAFGVREQIRAS